MTLARALELEVLRQAGPEVLAGADGLDRPVRWVHSTELPDIGPLLREGDLLLSTGIALPDHPTGLRSFAAGLTASGAAGIILELGRRWSSVPAALVESCEVLGLPLIALHHEVSFAAVTQSLGEQIVDERLGELREAQEVHETFTELSIGEAGPEQILEAVQRLTGATVVLESGDHRVVDVRTGSTGDRDFLRDWTRRSRSVPLEGRTAWDRRHGWLITGLGRRERHWGRLVVQSPVEPSQRLVAVVERGASALAMHRLHDRNRSSQVRRTHQEIVLGLLHDPADTQVLRRCELAGFPTSGHHYVAVAIRPVANGAQSLTQVVDDVMAAVVHAAETSGAPGLVCESDHEVRALIAVTSRDTADPAVAAIAAAVHRRRGVVMAAGRPVGSISEADRTLRESAHVLTSVRESGSRPVHRLEDVHLLGLLTLLADDDRLRLYVDRELEPLLRDPVAGPGHLAVLEALLSHPTSKSEAAASLHLSRPAFYGRLHRVETILGVDLDDPDTRVSLHVAILAFRQRAARNP